MLFNRAERLWMIAGIATLVVFLIVIGGTALLEGILPPSHMQTIDPTKVAQTAPFDNPGVRQISAGQYEAYVIARYPAFTPHELDVPAGARVTFYVTSPDVVHGFFIPNTDVNMMVMPGWVSTTTHVFSMPGEYLLLCNEYCGVDHHFMYGKVVVR